MLQRFSQQEGEGVTCVLREEQPSGAHVRTTRVTYHSDERLVLDVGTYYVQTMKEGVKRRAMKVSQSCRNNAAPTVLGWRRRVPIRRSTSGNGSPARAGFHPLLAGRMLSGDAAAAGVTRRASPENWDPPMRSATRVCRTKSTWPRLRLMSVRWPETSRDYRCGDLCPWPILDVMAPSARFGRQPVAYVPRCCGDGSVC
jgi:hypothetical protein